MMIPRLFKVLHECHKVTGGYWYAAIGIVVVVALAWYFRRKK